MNDNATADQLNTAGQKLTYNSLRCFYADTITDFISTPADIIRGRLSDGHGHSFASLESTQGRAWEEEIAILKSLLATYSGRGTIAMEFNIPRMGRYIDVVLLIDGIVFVIEFKAFKESFLKSDVAQVLEYVYDLHNFHEPSHDRVIVPVLVATEASKHANTFEFMANPKIFNILTASAKTLSAVIARALSTIPHQQPFDATQWLNGRYYPTPDIIEVSRLLYSGHDVKEISRNDAAAKSLASTTQAVVDIVNHSHTNSQKSICFVTGVPGAGKTLVGLNLASQHLANEKKLAVYLTGNFPLCAVLQEALARDAVLRDKMSGNSTTRLTKTQARENVKRSIQMVHLYRDEGVKTMGTQGTDGLLAEHVTIFDEAQRSWTKEQLRNFMARKKGIPGFEHSEAEFLMSCVNRHKDWGVVVCLVGGGQDINTGEAGIAEWFKALQLPEFKDWHIYVSDKLYGKEYESGDALIKLSERDNFHATPELHLSVSNRSFRAENLANFIQHLLDINIDEAKSVLKTLNEYPIVVTRDIAKAKQWIKEQSEKQGGRYGVVASSAGERLKPESVTVRLKPDVVHWFLDDKSDVRSSMFMEDVATEFDIQGLELDWVCLAWDADLRYSADGWQYYQFNGSSKWHNINNEVRRRYRLNAYRVLLTRARRGMAIFVPKGDQSDPTRSPKFYDGVYDYLTDLGIPEI